MKKDFYSTAEVAQILNISRVSVFNRIKSGKLKATKVGRNFIVTHEELLEALGDRIGPAKKEQIEKAINRAMKDYKEVFEKLAKE
jgi:excisionase family DNA binding protein